MSESLLLISDDLTLSIGPSAVRITPSQGLELSEQLARKSFRRALTEEAFKLDASVSQEPGRA